MDRRSFLRATSTGAAVLAFPSILRADTGPIRIGFPIPLSGPFGAIAKDQQQGAIVAMEEINASGGVLGRKLELLFRDDELKPATGAQRAQELIEREHVSFMAGVIAAHVQMAVNEQTRKAKMLFFSLSQSDEITAKPDGSRYTFHEAMNPTITARAVGNWAVKNLGKQRWWIIYADYAWGKQINHNFHQVLEKAGGSIIGTTAYPLGSSEFSAHIPKIQAAKPDVLCAVTPGADGIAFMKQAISFGLKKSMKVLVPLHFVFGAKEGGPELFADVYGGTRFYWELEDTIPNAKRFVEGVRKRFGNPPDAYGGYGYSGIHEIARGVGLAKSLDSEAVGNALRANPVYDHYKGKQWWRPCDDKSFQDVYIVKGRDPHKVRGDWGFFEIVDRVPASEEYDRTCAEKGWT